MGIQSLRLLMTFFTSNHVLTKNGNWILSPLLSFFTPKYVQTENGNCSLCPLMTFLYPKICTNRKWEFTLWGLWWRFFTPNHVLTKNGNCSLRLWLPFSTPKHVLTKIGNSLFEASDDPFNTKTYTKRILIHSNFQSVHAALRAIRLWTPMLFVDCRF